MEKHLWSLIATVFWKKDFSRLGTLQAVKYTVKKRYKIDSLLETTNRKYHMTLKVIRLLQDLSNAIGRTFVRHFTRFQLTRRVARSLGDSWASCSYIWSGFYPVVNAVRTVCKEGATQRSGDPRSSVCLSVPSIASSSSSSSSVRRRDLCCWAPCEQQISLDSRRRCHMKLSPHLLKIRCAVPNTWSRTDKHTYRHAHTHHNTRLARLWGGK